MKDKGTEKNSYIADYAEISLWDSYLQPCELQRHKKFREYIEYIFLNYLKI